MIIINFFRTLFAWPWTVLISFTTILCSFFNKSSEKVWTTAVSFWASSSLKILGVKVQVLHQENIKGPAIFIANHESVVDVLSVPHILPPKTSFVAKKEISRIPGVGTVMERGHCIFIDRTHSRNAIEAIKKGLENFPKGQSIIVFPEGSRRSGEKIASFKKGFIHMAIQANLPVVPIGHAGAAKLAYGKSFIVKPGKVVLAVGKAMDSSDWKNRDLNEILGEVREKVIQLKAEAESHL